VKAAAWLLLIGLIWPYFSDGYERVLLAVAPRVAGLVGLHLAAGPAGASAWLVTPLALMLGASASIGRRAAAVGLTLVAALTADVMVLLLANSLGGSIEQSMAAYRSVQAILPFAVVIIFCKGRPSTLWTGIR
jgi:hypothetical protein